MTADSAPSPSSVKAVNQNPCANRFTIAASDCDVNNKQKLLRYRDKWFEWMKWYEHNDSEPNSIESQIHRMLFNDLTYRGIVSVRASVDTDLRISARSATLAYLLDHGYVVSQVLSIQKLLDPRKDVISVKRLLRDIEKHRELITREIYVAGDGHPYDYASWGQTVSPSDPMPQILGIEAPGLVRFAISKDLHDKFDLLSGKRARERTRDDVIPKSIFRTLDSWISGRSADDISEIRNTFIAHSADAIRRGSAQFTGVKFSQIDELQQAIVRVERALTDYVLSRRVARDVVPFPPLGIFSGLGLPYCPPETEDSMHQRWDELSEDRNAWTQGVLQDLATGHGNS
jgi:AbiU2